MNLPRLATAVVLALLCVPGIARSELTYRDGEFQVNTYTTNEQRTLPARSVARAPSGEFVVVWSDSDRDGDGTAVAARRYDASGAPAGPDFQVNTYTTSDQGEAAVAVAPGGRFVVVWESNPGSVICASNADCTPAEFCNVNFRCDGIGQDGGRAGIFGRVYDETGSPVTGDLLINGYTLLAQEAPAVAMDADGNFMVVWQAQNQPGGFEYDIYAATFDSTGAAIAGEFMVNTTTVSGQRDTTVAAGGDSSFVVVWESGGTIDGDSRAVLGQRVDLAGIPVGTEFLVNTYSTGDQINPIVATSRTASGEFVVVWESTYAQDGDGRGLFGQRFGGDGLPVGGEFQVNAYTTGDQDDAAVAMDTDGSFLVAWEDFDADRIGVFAQAFDADGAPSGGQMMLNTHFVHKQGDPSLATDGAGGFVAVWEGGGGQDGDNEGVFAQLLCSDEDGDGVCDLRCAPLPLGGCRQGEPGKSKLQLVNKTPDSRDALKWVWGKGASTTLADLGDPAGAGNVDYLICVYDGSPREQPILENHVPSLGSCDGRPCWRAAADRGFKYKDRAGTADGILGATLLAGASGRARVIVKGRGENLLMPVLPVEGPVTAQLVALTEGGEECWETVFVGARKSDDRSYKAQGP